MKLSDTEVQMVEKLRQRQQRFQRRKLFLLIAYGVLMVVYLVLMMVMSNFPANGNDMTKFIVVAFMEPPLFALFLINTYFFVQVIMKWNGEPTTDLLLRVIEHLQHPTLESADLPKISPKTC